MRDVRPGHQHRMQRCPMKGRLHVVGEAVERVPRRMPSDPPAGGQKGESPRTNAYTALLRSCIGSCMIWASRWFLRAYTPSPTWTMSSTKSLACARPWDDAARTTAESRFRSPGTTPAIRDSVHLQPCSLHAMNSTALSVRGSSAVNSSTRLPRVVPPPRPAYTASACGQCPPPAPHRRYRGGLVSPHA